MHNSKYQDTKTIRVPFRNKSKTWLMQNFRLSRAAMQILDFQEQICRFELCLATIT